MCIDCYRGMCGKQNEVEKCREHELIQIQLQKKIPIWCNICWKQFDININKYIYSDKDDYDLCEACVDTEKGKKMVEKKWLKKKELKFHIKLTNFGSLCDWIPLYIDEKFNRIYVS